MTELISSFQLPNIWNFRPFFTLQPVRATREKQVLLWQDLIIKYHAQTCQFTMVPNDFPYFHNVTIERRLSNDAINHIIECMILSGCAEWDDSEHSRLLIMWRKPEVIAGDIYDWAVRNHYIGSVFTIYELHSGDDHRDSSEFKT